MGIYSAIFKKLTGNGKTKTKKPKNKKMKLKKLSPEQKAKLKGAFGKAKDFVQSGNAQNVSNTLTRYSQGKAVVIQNKGIKQTAKADTVTVFGYAIPKTTAYIGGTILGAGLIYGISKAVKH